YAKRPLRGASHIWRREGDSLGAARLALRAVAAPPCHPLRGWSNPTWGPHRNLSPPDTQNAPCGALRVSGGERGIRTPEALFRRLHTFQACSFNHSDTSPGGPAGGVPAARRGAEILAAATLYHNRTARAGKGGACIGPGQSEPRHGTMDACPTSSSPASGAPGGSPNWWARNTWSGP